MKRLLTAALGCLAGLAFSAIAVAAAPPDDYNVGLNAGLEISKTLLGGGIAAGIKGCQSEAEIITLAATAKARGIDHAKALSVFDGVPSGPIARQVYDGELSPQPAAFDHLNACLVRLRAKLE